MENITVIARLDPAIHQKRVHEEDGMPGSSPGMTKSIIIGA
jgi:hypothetical protein